MIGTIIDSVFSFLDQFLYTPDHSSILVLHLLEMYFLSHYLERIIIILKLLPHFGGNSDLIKVTFLVVEFIFQIIFSFFQFYSGKVLYHLRQHAIEIRWLNMSHKSLEVSESNQFDFGLVIFTTGYMRFLYEKIPDWHSELMENKELRIGILEYPQ